MARPYVRSSDAVNLSRRSVDRGLDQARGLVTPYGDAGTVIRVRRGPALGPLQLRAVSALALNQSRLAIDASRLAPKEVVLK